MTNLWFNTPDPAVQPDAPSQPDPQPVDAPSQLGLWTRLMSSSNPIIMLLTLPFDVLDTVVHTTKHGTDMGTRNQTLYRP